jgi:U3 small nucleolar RNA-associated protein 15
MRVDHGQPVQAAVVLPGGGVLATAGGNVIKIWDLLGGGRLLQAMCNHSKPITSLAIDGDGGRLLSGSLDHHLKV